MIKKNKHSRNVGISSKKTDAKKDMCDLKIKEMQERDFRSRVSREHDIENTQSKK